MAGASRDHVGNDSSGLFCRFASEFRDISSELFTVLPLLFRDVSDCSSPLLSSDLGGIFYTVYCPLISLRGITGGELKMWFRGLLWAYVLRASCVSVAPCFYFLGSWGWDPV